MDLIHPDIQKVRVEVWAVEAGQVADGEWVAARVS